MRHLDREARPVRPDLLQHLSPLGWQHINLTGDYLWSGPSASDGKLRPLRQPPGCRYEPVQGGDDLAARWSSGGRQLFQPTYRDRILGPAYRSVTLAGKGIWRSEQAFLAGQRARVGIVPTSGGVFTMRIVDEDHQTTCNASLSHSRCDWVPAYTSRFSIVLRNEGDRSEEYLIVVQ